MSELLAEQAPTAHRTEGQQAEGDANHAATRRNNSKASINQLRGQTLLPIYLTQVPLTKQFTSAHSYQAPCMLSPPVSAKTVACHVSTGPAQAERIAEFAGSGFLFKDNIEVMALDDDGGKFGDAAIIKRQSYFTTATPQTPPPLSPQSRVSRYTCRILNAALLTSLRKTFSRSRARHRSRAPSVAP